ncbi:acyl-CoA synthetase [Pusillimonas sp. ANT_WB101]|uniref:acyl-CoA synthetase n=1 Tax=Pusillimonas sp. ANT_WB101 TaxID=2597356 RepID=UPI0011EBD923|nr:acyl-CoA synthetase [Pusillimonas sp. ANT_WB101]KAA0889305.1 acyl-CoA synthetase [Pusillimonas sp. ANT_WB101]
MTAPFASAFQVKSIEDVLEIEKTPIEAAIPVRNTYELFCNSARAFGNKTALTFLHSTEADDTPIRWSYAELLRKITQTANALGSLGVGPDDVVSILLPACPEYHLALWGGEAAGIVQPLNPLLNDDKLMSLMNAAQSKILIVWGSDEDAGMWAKAMRLRDRVPSLTGVFRIAPHGEAKSAAPALPAGVADFNAFIAQQPDHQLVSKRDIAPTDIAAYFHTGGTTGAPKLARHSHGAQVFTAWAFVQMQGMQHTDITINGYPLFHVAGAITGSLSCLSSGIEIVIPTTTLFRNRSVIKDYWRLVERHKSTYLSVVPTVLAALTTVPLDGADISSLRNCRTGAAILEPELAARFKRLFGLHIHESLGMTEMAGISTVTPPAHQAPAGCVGFRLPYSQLRIVEVDESGKPSSKDMPVGEQGMILFKAPNVFSGFVDPIDNAQAFTEDGWLITGDLGWLDEQERLHLSGRAKDLIIRSGHNIDPKVIEDALGAHPAVHMCAAVGAPDAYAGELPVVFATLMPGAVASPAELLAFTCERVDEAPARPRQLYIIDQMPLTNVGKIYKPELRLRAALEVTQGLIASICDHLGIPTSARPCVDTPGEDTVRISFAGCEAIHKALFAEMKAEIEKELGPLPIKAQLEGSENLSFSEQS